MSSKRVQRAATQNYRYLQRALNSGSTVYGAVPTHTTDSGSILGTWEFYRGKISDIKRKRNLLGRCVGVIVTLDTDKGETVTLLGSQVRYRGAEAFSSTPVTFEIVAMNVSERLNKRAEKLSGQINGEIHRPYDFNYSHAKGTLRNVRQALEVISVLPQEVEQIAECIKREFDYPQRSLSAPGNKTLYDELMREAMGRLPFYDQLALNVLAGWNDPYNNESSYRHYPTWQHGDNVYRHMPNIVQLAVEACAVGPDAENAVGSGLYIS